MGLEHALTASCVCVPRVETSQHDTTTLCAVCSHNLCARRLHLRARAHFRPQHDTRAYQRSALPVGGGRVWGPNRHIDDVACSRRQHVASPAAEATARRFAPGCCCSTNLNSSAHSARQGANAAALQSPRRRRRVNVETFASGGARANRREGSPQFPWFFSQETGGWAQGASESAQNRQPPVPVLRRTAGARARPRGSRPPARSHPRARICARAGRAHNPLLHHLAHPATVRHPATRTPEAASAHRTPSHPLAAR